MTRRMSETGYRGVYYYGERYIVRISTGERMWGDTYRKRNVGIFDDLSEAIRAYEEAKEERRIEKERAKYNRMIARRERAGLPPEPVKREKTHEYVGVIRRRDSYIASISINRVCKYLGSYKTPEEARDAYLAAKRARDNDAQQRDD